MFSAIIFLLILSFLVIIHEAGHFFTAIWMKIRVEEFGLGYPPRALTLFKWKGVPFTLNWLPFGGFVKMEGEDHPVPEDEKQVTTLKNKLSTKSVQNKKKDDGIGPFYTKSKMARLVVLLAGVSVNFVFGVLVFALTAMIVGIPELTTSAIVTAIVEGAPAQVAGMQVGDEIVSLQKNCVIPETECDGEKTEVEDVAQLVSYINSNLGQNIWISYKRGEEVRSVLLYTRPADQRPEGEGAIGVSFDGLVYRHYPWWQMPVRGAWVGIQQSLWLSVQIIRAFGDLFTRIFLHAQVPQEVSGPVGIVHQAGKLGLFKQGWLATLNFAGMLSINLAILNLLPIPALDGGRAFFVIAETVIGKKRREKYEGHLNYFGFLFLLCLIFLITAKDIWVIIQDWLA